MRPASYAVCFPTKPTRPRGANFDILLRAVGSLSITPTDDGYEVAVLPGPGNGAVAAAPRPAPQPETAAAAPQAAAEPAEAPAAQAPSTEGMTELERTVLAEIEAAGRGEAAEEQTIEEAAREAAASDEGEPAVAEPAAQPEPAVADTGERARVVLPAATGDEAAAAAEPAPATGPAPEPVAEAPPAAPQPEPRAPAAPAEPAAMAEAQPGEPAAAMPPPVEFRVEQGSMAGDVPPPPDVSESDEPLADAQPAAPVTPSPPAAQPSAAAAGQPARRARLEAITYSELPGGRLQVNFNTGAATIEPGVFRTNQPPRIVVDFFDTESAVVETIQRVGFGALESIVTAETDDRTRVILNLVAPVEFQQRQVDGGVVLVMSSPTDIQVATRRQEPSAFEQVGARDLDFSVDNVDFRRTPEGGGRVTVKLNSPEIGVDVREEAGEIVIDFPSTDLPPELEKRLDVTDFATPVQSIDTFFTGSGARMIVSPVGEYSYSSYQVGDTLTVQVSPVAPGDREREPDEFGYSGERLSFNFQRISVRAALQVIADFTGLNFVTSDSVSGDLSLRLQDVPWDQCARHDSPGQGHGQRQRGNVIWVAPAEEIAAKERQALEAQNQVTELEPLVSELIQINYAKAEDIASILKSVRAVDTGYQQSLFGSVTISQLETESNSLLSERGNVTVDPRTNTILVQDTRSKIREIRNLIARLDRPVRRCSSRPASSRPTTISAATSAPGSASPASPRTRASPARATPTSAPCSVRRASRTTTSFAPAAASATAEASA
ncbi:MAG: AMIN domain-containing protein [Gammaproteobacteria bacterium]|nr:AMIN domain-containing protein [Gammaproteobacteria bacterium]